MSRIFGVKASENRETLPKQEKVAETGRAVLRKSKVEHMQQSSATKKDRNAPTEHMDKHNKHSVIYTICKASASPVSVMMSGLCYCFLGRNKHVLLLVL